MQTKQLSAAVAALLGVLFLVAAVLYFTQAAGALPAFLPGHVAAGSVRAMDHHRRHGLLALALSVVCFAAIRFLRGPASAERPTL